MKKTLFAFGLSLLLFSLSACAGNLAQADTGVENQRIQGQQSEHLQGTKTEAGKNTQEQTEQQIQTVQEEGNMNTITNTNVNTQITVMINGQHFSAELNDSQAAREFYQLLPMTVDMTDLHGNEKYYILPNELTDEDINVDKIELGDIMLYNADYLVLFYDSFETSYAYTPLGKIIDTTGLAEALGKGNVTVTFQATAEMSEEIQQSENTNLDESQMGKFNFETKTVLLNSGYEMPILGLGTYSLLDEECVNSVATELQNGGRLIDTAYMYHNEESVGEGIRKAGVPREEIFVTTKLYPNQFADAENAINEALAKLDVGYIDLMLLHHPGDGDVEAYKAMERAVKEGKIRSIGLSNWYIEELEEFLPQITITPAVVQNEIHPYYQESEVIEYIHSLGIVVEGWYPLGGRGYTAELLGDATISAIAQAHQVSSAQVILRWNLQKSVVVIPGSSNPDHIKENLDLFDFALSNEEMGQINALNRDEKHDWY